MPTADRSARAIQRANVIAMSIYAASVAVLSPRFLEWPRRLASFPRVHGGDSFISRMMLDHPAMVWLAIPAALLVANGLSIAVGDRGHLLKAWSPAGAPDMSPDTIAEIRGARSRALAWLGCVMTLFTAFVSVIFYAGWRAVEQNDPAVLFRGVTLGIATLAPIILLLLGASVRNAYLVAKPRQRG